MRGYAMTAIVAAASPEAEGRAGVERSSNTPSSSGRPCCHHIGKVATVGTPVRASSCSGAGDSSDASPRKRFSTKPLSNARSASGISAQVP